MELLIRKIAFTLIVSAFSLAGLAQVNVSDVFKNSYAREAEGNYAAAIKELAVLNGFEYYKNMRLGWLYYLSKNYESSKGYYQQATKIAPSSVEAWLGLCLPLEAKKETGELEAVYKKILSIDPMNSKINYALATIYYYKKEFALAEKYYDIVVKLYPFDYYSNLMAGWTKYFLGKKNDAKRLFNTVLIISPSDKSAKEGLGLIK